jgi:hypothetical protein
VRSCGRGFLEGDDEDTGDDEQTTHATQHNGLFTSEQARVLRAIAANPDEFQVVGLAAGRNQELLERIELHFDQSGSFVRGEIEDEAT